MTAQHLGYGERRLHLLFRRGHCRCGRQPFAPGESSNSFLDECIYTEKYEQEWFFCPSEQNAATPCTTFCVEASAHGIELEGTCTAGSLVSGLTRFLARSTSKGPRRWRNERGQHSVATFNFLISRTHRTVRFEKTCRAGRRCWRGRIRPRAATSEPLGIVGRRRLPSPLADAPADETLTRRCPRISRPSEITFVRTPAPRRSNQKESSGSLPAFGSSATRRPAGVPSRTAPRGEGGWVY
jgi:hypothetical protein